MKERPARIYSERAGDPDLEEALDQFVLGLAERIDRLQDAQALGYPQLVGAGSALLDASRRRDAAPVLEGVREITDLGYRVRLGHRGAF